jgi:hypothetical protein
MVKRIPITDSNKATFICPKCKTMKTVDVSKFVHTDRVVKIKSKCSCGHRWTSQFEKRKQYRKTVNFAGTYDYIKDGKVADKGGITVLDLSNGGAKLKLNVERDLQVGDNLDLEFQLDDNNATLIKKRVAICSINGSYIGTTFGSPDNIGTELGFYLMK